MHWKWGSLGLKTCVSKYVHSYFNVYKLEDCVPGFGEILLAFTNLSKYAIYLLFVDLQVNVPSINLLYF